MLREDTQALHNLLLDVAIEVTVVLDEAFVQELK